MGQIKKFDEIEKIKYACRITDKIFAKMRKYLNSVISTEMSETNEVEKSLRSLDSAALHSRGQKRSTITEKQLETWLLEQIKQAGCIPSFHPIIAAGANAAHPHWRANDTMLHSFVVIDFGVVYQGYMSDMTRTIYIGTPSEEEKKLYSLVLKAQEDSMQYIKLGRYYKDAHRVAAATLGSQRKHFIHSLGHGIGTIIHEHPRIGPKGTGRFKKNMCITVEPGVYYEGKLGIRIEDTCLVSNDVCIALTKSTKKLLCFG